MSSLPFSPFPTTRPTDAFPSSRLPPIAAVAAAGYAANAYRQTAAERRAVEAERQARESGRLAAELMDAYGDGESLDALERAVAVYESQNRR